MIRTTGLWSIIYSIRGIISKGSVISEWRSKGLHHRFEGGRNRFCRKELLKSPTKTEDTVRTPNELFGHNILVFPHCYAYLWTQRNGESLGNYIGLVNRRHRKAEFNVVSSEQNKCLIWICDLHSAQDTEILARALREIEERSQTTLKSSVSGSSICWTSDETPRCVAIYHHYFS